MVSTRRNATWRSLVSGLLRHLRTGAQRASPSYSQAARSDRYVRIVKIRRYYCHADSALILDQQVHTNARQPPFFDAEFHGSSMRLHLATIPARHHEWA